MLASEGLSRAVVCLHEALIGSVSASNRLSYNALRYAVSLRHRLTPSAYATFYVEQRRRLPAGSYDSCRPCKARSILATMSKQRSTSSKGQNFNAKLVRHCCRFWQQSRTLLRHCCWCGPGFRLPDRSVTFSVLLS